MTTTTTLAREYRAARRPKDYGPMDHLGGRHHVWHTPARNALAMARDELALRAAEVDDRIRFRWEYDWDPSIYWDVDDGTGTNDWADELRATVESGEVEVMGCIAEIHQPPRLHHNDNGSWYCWNCRRIVILFDDDTHDDCDESWEEADSLWGIGIDVGDRWGCKREVERELACEAGVI
ncbi:MAG: hypothetical protein GY773_00945 [Actinomycetia bacterium]|nr:hypothetical protein [Actinomycetes bacterium]